MMLEIWALLYLVLMVIGKIEATGSNFIIVWMLTCSGCICRAIRNSGRR